MSFERKGLNIVFGGRNGVNGSERGGQLCESHSFITWTSSPQPPMKQYEVDIPPTNDIKCDKVKLTVTRQRGIFCVTIGIV